ncbi:MAG: DNA polymerase III subunit delta [Elusimicrobiota bacterium]|jgi:DNA polymerase-3 subunit delta|nr:DNA polymerase III subunit delta [Elusimicrobiota bacterium]
MKEISYFEFSRLKISASNFLLFGEENYLISEALNKIQKALSIDALNKEVFYCGDCRIEDILYALKTIPFLNSKRLVIVKEAEKIKSAAAAQNLADYFDNPSESSCLVICYCASYKKDKSEERKKLISKCLKSKHCIAVDCKKVYEREAASFIKSKFAELGKNSSQEAADALIEEQGCELQILSKEIEKVALFAGKDKKNISREDVETAGGYTKDINAYNLTSLLEEKKAKKALFVLEKLLEQGEEPLKILSSIIYCARQMLKIKSMIEEGAKTMPEIYPHLRMHPYYQKSFLENLSRHKLKTLKKTLRQTLNADLAVKTGGDVFMNLEKTVLLLCSD